jgi:hypothetical protein
MGFRFKSKNDRRNALLLESSEIVRLRIRYIQEVTRLRNEGWNLFWTDESYTHQNAAVEKAWQDTELLSARFAFDNGFTTGLPSLSGKGKRIILVHIGNENGFLNGAGTCWVSGNKTDDYHDDMCFKVTTTQIQYIYILLLLSNSQYGV